MTVIELRIKMCKKRKIYTVSFLYIKKNDEICMPFVE
jgi:hypothetical protein